VFGDLQQRHVGDADGNSGSRLYFYGLERRMHGHGFLRCDHERGQIGNGNVYRSAAYGALGSVDPINLASRSLANLKREKSAPPGRSFFYVDSRRQRELSG